MILNQKNIQINLMNFKMKLNRYYNKLFLKIKIPLD